MKALVLFVFLVGCVGNKITMLRTEDPVTLRDCKVKIFPSLEEAKTGGEIESVCMISREETLMVSTSEAVANAAPAVCKCGTNFVYVKSTTPPSFINNSTVELVGFRYKGK